MAANADLEISGFDILREDEDEVGEQKAPESAGHD